ncbi:hypothetical protein ACIPWL_19485 [Streptomyces sp. NPDC090023]
MTFALVAGIPAPALTGGRYLAESTGAEALTWLSARRPGPSRCSAR